jgi:menaquinone-dependent protoporphyrinogen oxidase
MKPHILVAYATKYGSTAEIADKIGAVLRDEGLSAEVFPVTEVKDLSHYTAVVLGSGVYIGKWRKEAASFLKTHEKALSHRTVWLFSSGPTGEGNAEEIMDGWTFPQDLQPVADRIDPTDTVVFHGEINSDKMNFIEKKMIKAVKAPHGDFRDWDAISTWGREIANTVKSSQQNA